MREHELKTDPAVFAATFAREKAFEIRKNDRNFQVGDVLRLRETKYTGEEMRERHSGGFPGRLIAGKPLVYTGREMRVKVQYILDGPIYGLAPGWCIMAIDFL